MMEVAMRYKFGECELVPASHELVVAGQPRPVEPQVFDLLHHLVKERERVVSSDELIQVIWNGRIVSESAINSRISAARSAIGDDGTRQEWIKTVRGRGFRFIGAVTPVGPKPDSAEIPESSTAGRQRIAFCRSADETRIAYAALGNGYPLVKAGHWLTHLEHDMRNPIWRPFLDELGRKFHLVRYDQRGNGLSDWDVTDFALDRFVEDLEAVVDAAGLDRFALYGLSQGAPIAIAYICRHPERVSHLILQGGYEQGRLVRSEVEREQAQAIITLIKHGWGKRDSAFNDAIATVYIPDGDREQIDAIADLQKHSTSAANAAALRIAVDNFDVSALSAKVEVPTLVMHSRDESVQPLEQARQLASKIRQAEFVLLESRNHVILPQEPAWKVMFGEIERFVLGA